MAQLLLFCLFQLLPLTAMASQFAHPAYDDSPLCSVSRDADELADLSSKPVKLEEYGNGRIIDITHAYRPDMPSFNSTDSIGMVVSLHNSMANGDLCNFSELKIGIHTGTHVDAPGHVYQEYYEAGFDVDSLDLEVLNGPALLVDVPRDKNITAEVIESLHIPRGVRRVIFRTLNTDRKLMWKKKFDTSYVGFMKDGAQWLVDNTDIKLVGVDYLSVAAFDDLIPAHLVFLKSRGIFYGTVEDMDPEASSTRTEPYDNVEIILVEALKLDGVKPGIYSLHCLPLRLVGAEGSPIRCILIK